MKKLGLPFSSDFYNRYEVIEAIGKGAMGTVYKGRHLDLGRPVAIKCLTSTGGSEAEVQARFRREAKLLAAVDHPNVVSIYEFIVDGGRLVIVEEFLDGAPLDEIALEGAQLPWQQVVSLGSQIAKGLVAVHKAKIVHRDLKPGNTILLGDGTVKIVDFGLAKAPDDMTRMTETGAILGTPLYMPPEQILGTRLSASADCYALGIILYSMLTGEIPHDGGNLTDFLAQRTTQPIKPIKEVLGDELPEKLAKLLDKSLRKDESLRPKANDMAKVLTALCVMKSFAASEIKEQAQLSLASTRKNPPLGRGEAYAKASDKSTARSKIAQSPVTDLSEFSTFSTKRALALAGLKVMALLLPLCLLCWAFMGRPTIKKRTIELLEAKTSFVGARSLRYSIEASGLCRAALVVTSRASDKKIATVLANETNDSFELEVKGLSPDCEYMVEIRLRQRGKDILRQSQKVRTTALAPKAYIDVEKLIRPRLNRKKRAINYSGYTSPLGKMFLNVGHRGAALFSLRKKSIAWLVPKLSGGDHPMITKDRVVSLTNDERIYALHLDDGKKLWEHRYPSSLCHEFMLIDNMAIALERSKGLHSIDVLTGRKAWQVNKSFLTPPMIAYRNYALIRTDLLETFAFRAVDGVNDKKVRLMQGQLHPENWFTDDKEIFATFENGRFIAGDPFFPPRLAKLFKAPLSAVTASADHIYVLCLVPAKLIVLERSTGETSFEVPLPKRVSKNARMYFLQGLIFISEDRRFIICLDAKTGAKLFEFEGLVDNDFNLARFDDKAIFSTSLPALIYSVELR